LKQGLDYHFQCRFAPSAAAGKASAVTPRTSSKAFSVQLTGRRYFMKSIHFASVTFASLLGVVATVALAEGGAVQVALRSSSLGLAPEAALGAADALVLAAPPRDSAEEGHKRFGPVADYLSQVLGRKVVYKHPTTWGGYQADMQRGRYDIVFDGPHFNGWRVEKLQHNVLVKLPGEFVYTAVVRKDNTSVQHIKQLAGHKICAHAPPNLGTLMMYNEFDNPSRQPVVMVTDGYDNIFRALQEGKCDAAMLPLKHVQKHDKNGERTRVIFKNRALPQQAFSAGPRLSSAEQAKVAAALLAPAAQAPLAKFREAYSLGKDFVPATNAEYADVGAYLRNVWGYY
jgi:ABC-type phosphate/phosphonate transport system substrate-binding protein